MRKFLWVPVLAVAVLAGCTWGIKLTDGGQAIHTNWNGPMTACHELGKVTVSVADHLGPVNRNNVKVNDELQIMARNEAATMEGANTIHPLAKPVDGSQPWGVYQCAAGASQAGNDTSASSQAAGAQTFPVKSGD